MMPLQACIGNEPGGPGPAGPEATIRSGLAPRVERFPGAQLY